MVAVKDRTPAPALRDRRAELFALREISWGLTPPGGWPRCSGAECGNPRCSATPERTHPIFDRPRRCGRTGGYLTPGINRRPTLDGRGTGWRASLAGVETCGSIWVCPPCSAKIRYRRGQALDAVLRTHLEGGGGALFLTLTARHSHGMALAELLNAILEAWRTRIVAGAQWVKDQEIFDIIGWVRSVEVTWSFNAGWHPHLHAVLLTGRELSDTDREALAARIFNRWITKVAALLGADGAPSEEGQRLLPVYSSDVGLYITKMTGDGPEGTRSRLAVEMTRGDLKRGRGASLTPWELLRATTAESSFSGRARALWWDYEAATKGRRLMGWSKGLRELLGADTEEADRQLALDADVEAERVFTFQSPGELWRVASTPGLLALLLSVAEAGGTAAEVEAQIRLMIAVRAPKPPPLPPPKLRPPESWKQVIGQLDLVRDAAA